MQKSETKTSTETSIIPRGYRILIEPDPVQEKSSGGIIVTTNPKMERAGQVFGTLVAVGGLAWSGFKDEEPWAKVGDRVIYAKYAGKIVADPVTDEEFVILNDEDIIAVIGDKPEDTDV